MMVTVNVKVSTQLFSMFEIFVKKTLKGKISSLPLSKFPSLSHAFAQKYTHTHTYTHSLHTHTNIHSHTHTHTHTHSHTHTNIHSLTHTFKPLN